jgi:AraC-like DNA-binding protein
MRLRNKVSVLILPSTRLASTCALPAPFSLEILRDEAELLDVIPNTPPSTLVVLDCTTETERNAQLSIIGQLIHRYPSVPVIAAIDVHAVNPERAVRLLASGVAGVIDLSVETTPQVLAARLKASSATPFKQKVEDSLPRCVSAQARAILRGACDVAVVGGGARELATRFGVNSTTVTGWCTVAGLPTPRVLQAWLRLLLAAFLLADTGRMIATVARACGYSSDRALRRAMNQFVGFGTRTVRQESAFETVMGAFLNELARCRTQVRRS